LPEQYVVHHVIADVQSDLQQQQALQQVIDRIRKLNTVGTGTKKSRQSTSSSSLRRHLINNGSRSGRGFAYAT
jgi:hypothetical protein